jgi:homoserine dehydrogenase
MLRKKYGLAFSVHCVVDSSGVVISDDGFDLVRLLEHKVCGLKLRELHEFDEGLTLAVALDSVQCDILLEASPVDLNTGDPGLSNCRTGLVRGLHLVLANKAPLALAQAELVRLAADTDVGILYSATFCGGLPVLNIVRRDMVCGKILGFRGIFNATTNFILEEMLKGRDYADALRETQERGIAEADPSIDVCGWDTAAKLVIAANSIVDAMITLADVSVSGIEDVQLDWLEQCRSEGSVLKLVATTLLQPIELNVFNATHAHVSERYHRVHYTIRGDDEFGGSVPATDIYARISFSNPSFLSFAKRVCIVAPLQHFFQNEIRCGVENTSEA